MVVLGTFFHCSYSLMSALVAGWLLSPNEHIMCVKAHQNHCISSRQRPLKIFFFFLNTQKIIIKSNEGRDGTGVECFCASRIGKRWKLLCHPLMHTPVFDSVLRCFMLQGGWSQSYFCTLASCKCLMSVFLWHHGDPLQTIHPSSYLLSHIASYTFHYSLRDIFLNTFYMAA